MLYRFIALFSRLQNYDHYRLNYLTLTNVNNFSEIYTIRPYDSGFRGKFSSVSLQAASSSSASMQSIDLGWDYNTAYEGSLEEFKIYIRNPGKDDAFYLYKTVKVNKNQTTTNGLKANSSSAVQSSRYSARTQVSKDTSVANFAPTAIQYKIVAIHRDGGQSIYFANGSNNSSPKR